MRYRQQPIGRRAGICRLATLLPLFMILFAANDLKAQNPAYSFASRLGSTEVEYSNAIAIDASDNLYVTGRFTGTVDFDPGNGTANLTSAVTAGGSDIFVASYDATGNYRWAFNVGGTPPAGMDGYNRGVSIAVDGGGNVVVSGVFNGTMDFNPGVGTATLATVGTATFVARYSPTGNHLWSFRLGPYSNANDLAIDASGNIVVVGTFQGTVDFNPGSGTASLSSTNLSSRNSGNNTVDMFVAKYSSSGTYLWAFRVGNGYYETAAAVDIDGNGNIYLTGGFFYHLGSGGSSTVDFDPGKGRAELTGGGTYVARYTGAGAYVWAFKLGAYASSAPDGQNIAVDANGNVAVTGRFQGTVDFNPGSGTANLTGIATGGSTDIFVARYNASGSYQWAFTPAVGYAHGVSIDGNGDIYITGQFTGTNDFDPGSETETLADNAIYGAAAFVASYTASGAYRWAFPISGPPSEGRAIISNGSGDLFVTGTLSLTPDYLPADFDPGEGTAHLTSAGRLDIFIAKYTEVPLPKRAMEANTSGDARQVSVAPNPFSRDFTFRFDGGPAPARIEIIDMMGRVVESCELDGATDVTLGAELPAGAYIVQITHGETRRQVQIRKVE